MIIQKTVLKIISILMCLIFSFLMINKAGNRLYEQTCLSNYDECVEENIRAQDDFYDFINKEWFENNKLNYGCASYGTFQEASNKVNADVIKIMDNLEKNKKNYDSSSDELKVINLYEQYLDIGKRNEIGLEPIKKYISLVEEIKEIKDVNRLLLDEEFSYFQPLVNFGVGADYKDNSKNILYIGESELTLGNSYYYKDDMLKDIYIDYLKKLNKLSGLNEKDSIENAETFYNIEKKISRCILSREEESEQKNRFEWKYNKYTLKQLEKSFPNIKFKNLLKNFGLDRAKKIIVENPSNIKTVDGLLNNENLNDIKVYLRTCILLKSDSYLDENFRNASRKMKNKLYGSELCEVDKNTGVKFISDCVPELIGKLYIQSYFDYNSKHDVKKMIYEIINNFKERLKRNQWLSSETKKHAENKLQSLKVKVGYPDRWQDYSKLNIVSYNDGGNIINNLIEIYKFETQKQFSKINKSVDKDKWNMSACTVNAYYNPVNNEIVFPAGILQFPFYNKENSIEENLGAIGIIIGHELTHAFDNTGCQFDENGNLNNWWTEEDYKEFSKRSSVIADYYSQIKADNEMCLKGKLIVEENISDLGGMACALDIMSKLKEPDYKKFFESYARMWREVSTDEMKRYLLENDCHAPKKIRVNQILSQFDEFYKEYDVKAGDKMYVPKEKRIKMW